jgi:hypothetical protein
LLTTCVGQLVIVQTSKKNQIFFVSVQVLFMWLNCFGASVNCVTYDCV